MNLVSKWKTIAPATGVAALILWGLAGQDESVGAGSLTPPEGEPEPTMPSLEELGDKLDVLDSNGKNFAVRNTTSVQVWNSETGIFTPAQTVTGLSTVLESDGYFCARGSSTGAVWNKDTGTWSIVTNIQSASAIQASNGNFCIFGSGKITAWSHLTGTWSTRNLTGPSSISVSNGNFLVQGSSQVAAWSEQTGTWTTLNRSASFIGVISSQ